jgi:RNA exonuclease 1
MKLLAHRIPVYLPSQELVKIFSGNPSIEEKVLPELLLLVQ